MTAAHVFPHDDFIEHESNDDCTCGPRSEEVELTYGGVGWVVVHHSLDGRESQE